MTPSVKIDLTDEELVGDLRERRTIELPATYNDLTARPALLRRLREKLGDRDWQIEHITVNGDKLAMTVVDGLPVARPAGQVWRLSDAPGPRGAGTLDTIAQDRDGVGAGASVVQYDWDARRAVIAALPPATRQVRDTLARALKVDPWQLEVSVAHSAETGKPALIHVWRGASLVRTDSKAGRDRARHQAWLAVARDIWPTTGDDVWAVSYDNAATDRIALTCSSDPLAQIQEYPWDAPVTYESLPFGVAPDGNPVTMGLWELNFLLGGLPGGGKSGGNTALLAGISRLENVALIGLDPKRVELGAWLPRFSRISKGNTEDSVLVLEAIADEMDRRYAHIEEKGKKKLKPKEFSAETPMLVIVIDELADLMSIAADKDGKAMEEERQKLLRRIISMGRAAGIVVITATQKPSSKIIPTELRDLIQLRVGFATTTAAMTDTILGEGMSTLGAESHKIPASLPGACYYINEQSREPRRARTYWIDDDDLPEIAQRYSHLRVELPWMPEPGTPRRGQGGGTGDSRGGGTMAGFKPDMSKAARKSFNFAKKKGEGVQVAADPTAAGTVPVSQDPWLAGTPVWDFEEPPAEEDR